MAPELDEMPTSSGAMDSIQLQTGSSSSLAKIAHTRYSKVRGGYIPNHEGS